MNKDSQFLIFFFTTAYQFLKTLFFCGLGLMPLITATGPVFAVVRARVQVFTAKLNFGALTIF